MSREDRRGLLERSIANLTIGVAQSVRGREAALRDTYTGEWEQQVHISIAGTAGGLWSSTDQTVIFDVALMEAKDQRTVPFSTPHFTYGIEITQDTGQLIIVHAHVVGWRVNDFGWTTGATVRFAVSAPEQDPAIPFSAIAHLSFQGYGCLPEMEEFNT